MRIEQNIYLIELTEESISNASSLKKRYLKQYINSTEFKPSTIIGLEIYQDHRLLNSTCIGAEGGATGISPSMYVLEEKQFVLCCGNSIFCLSIPEFQLLWKTQADMATCFQIFKYKNQYIVHGELEISKLDIDGEILWQFSGEDIFVNLDNENEIEMTETHIRITDFSNTVFTIDYNGEIIKKEII